MTDADDTDDTNGTDGDERRGRAAAVVLAAGVGSRFDDSNKLLAGVGVDADPLVRRATETLCAAAVDPVVVVLGHDAERVCEALTGLPVETVVNPRYEAGQSTSVAAGVEALPADVEYAVFALADMPDVAVETVDRLVATARERDADAVVPTYEGQRGNPVVFHRRRFDALTAVEGDRGGRALFDDSTVTHLAVDDPGVRRDVDTRDDLAERE